MATDGHSYRLWQYLPTQTSVLVLVPGILFSYALTICVWQLFFSPLARIPGPKLAAVTGLYEFYYDCCKGGKYMFRIDEMHDKYGPIVRISPREVHIRDIDFYDRLYSVSSRLDKDWYFYRFIGTSEAGFGTPSAKIHQARRKAMSKFFSQSAINALEQSVQACVLKLCARLMEYKNTNQVVNLSNALRHLTVDVISEYALPSCKKLLDYRDFTEPVDHQSRNFSYIAIWHRHIPIIMPMLLAIPRWLVVRTANEDGIRTFDFHEDLKFHARAIFKASTAGKSATSQSTVLAGIMESELPSSDKTPFRLHQEAIVIVGAGSETTASTLETIIYHTLTKPHILSRLSAELASIRTPANELIPLNTLRCLPYLTAIVTEGLRLACGVSSRLPRIDPLNSLVYASHVLPPGTVVSMSIRDAHFDPVAFPDPQAFFPERWLVPPAERKLQDAHFMPFSRGSRACIGKELAQTELYLGIGSLFRRFEFELFETSAWDVSMQHDFFAPFGPAGSKGVRVLVK